MTLKKFSFSILLIAIFINIQINSMEESSEQFNEKKICYIENLPNELLFLIFYFRIHDIINNNYSLRAKEEFKKFLSSVRLLNKRFLQFKNKLEEYFDEHKKIKISDVYVDLENYTIRFRIGYIEFKTDANDIKDLKIIDDIFHSSAATLTEVGLEISAKDPRQLTLIKPLLINYKNSPTPNGKYNDYWTEDLVYNIY